MRSVQDSIYEIYKEIMLSTYPSYRESVCRRLEKVAKNAGIGSDEEFKYTDDEPISQEVYDNEYEFYTIDVQSVLDITKLQEDIKAM
mmetsp:Transcript_42445/g.49520  ORF Transcript_42445/g.49520 Transcript_42445/m.49520 type:complete len:87 (+) Transcript_42445:477-737(+)